jgi:NAD+ dependent glucose-6-phosphate dehydrogenase
VKIGITGAAGNIGTTLRKGLAPDHELSLFDLRPVSGAGEGRFVRLDGADREALRGAFGGLEVLIHLAGDPSPGAPPESTMRNNFAATSFVFEEARAARVRTIVFASSNFYHEAAITETLHAGGRGSITLADPPTARSLYGQSKVYGENLGRHLAYLGTAFVALRIGWTVPGDDPSPYAGEYMRAVWCSHRDLVDAFQRALAVDTGFVAAYAVSANTRGVFDLAGTREALGFSPRDDAETRLRNG